MRCEEEESRRIDAGGSRPNPFLIGGPLTHRRTTLQLQVHALGRDRFKHSNLFLSGGRVGNTIPGYHYHYNSCAITPKKIPSNHTPRILRLQSASACLPPEARVCVSALLLHSQPKEKRLKGCIGFISSCFILGTCVEFSKTKTLGVSIQTRQLGLNLDKALGQHAPR